MDKFQVKILDIKEEYKYVWTYTLEKPDDLNWDEGSSFHLALPGYDETCLLYTSPSPRDS